ncbi:hypothetical protein F3Y22_tig00116958pilonHSYRG00030 [Hibiscus syriacus]|uniref:RRM domain-containing protein n=1 Tax=Hibiscus syriacus TaxID=106335 RepID=A0A6A2XZ45_HIBSY|nr:hypothetical protein F3Y22_tig00116958pilonHSYRG00030 [Hibiscus syriacus]
MATSHLLRLKPQGLHFNGRGLTRSTKWYFISSFSSDGTEKSSFLKGLKGSKEGKAGDKEPKNESGVWFKGILSNLKQTVLGSLWFQKSISRETSDAKVDTEEYDVTATEHSSPSTKSFKSVDVPKSTEFVMSSPGGSKVDSSCSASDTIGGNAFEEPDVNASSSDNVALGDIQTIVHPPEAVRVSHGYELSTSVTDVLEKNSLKMNQSRKLSDIFGKKMENNAERFQGAMLDVLEPISKKPATFPDGKNDLFEIINHLPGNRTATFVQRPTASTNSGKNHTSSESSSRVEDLMNVMLRKTNDPTAGEMAGNVHNTLAPTESSKGKKIEKNIKINGLFEEMKGLFGEEQTIKAQERTIPDATDQRSIGGFLKNDQSSANFQESDVQKILWKVKGLLGEELTVKALERIISNVTDQQSKGGFCNNVRSPANLQNSDVKRRRTLLKQTFGEEQTIKDQERIISNVTDQRSNGGFFNNVQSPANLQNTNVKRSTLFKEHLMSHGNKMSLDKKEESSFLTESISEKEDSNLNLTNSNNIKSGPNSNASHSVSREEVGSHLQTCFLSEQGSKDNKVLVRFLTKKVEKHNILESFSDCGPVVNIEEFSSTKQSSFKDFLIHFETREGSETALKKNDPIIMNAEAFVESISSEDSGSAISIPDLIGDPEAPSALVKNPTKTVKVKHLPEDISSQKLKEELAFCHSNISNICFGSTSSAVYVEFETEDAKERALAQQSILVSGRKLSILRIDAPMTTVVRISNVNHNSDFRKICNSYGEVKYLVTRTMGVVDVHFKLAEWPNMLNIVNSLNGLEVDENRWLALPAPVFPPVILRALWCRPEERQHVNAVIYKLLREVEKPISTTELSQSTNLATRYCGKEF